MYAGTTLSNKSGHIMGVHQKIDRVARKHLQPLLADKANFPNYKQIVHFEGKNGPDGIKRKSPAIDEPWHFMNPEDPNDTALLDTVEEHYQNLVVALRDDNQQRAAFEAAWMSHAVVDGLTPAHHYPLETVLSELRNGEGLETRTSVLKKNIMLGSTALETIRNNWKFWGAKGAMTMHGGYELGVASVIAYRRFNAGAPSQSDIVEARAIGYRQYFLRYAKEVSKMKIYDEFAMTGWTAKLAKQTNQELMPLIIKTVTIGWLLASEESLKGGI